MVRDWTSRRWAVFNLAQGTLSRRMAEIAAQEQERNRQIGDAVKGERPSEAERSDRIMRCNYDAACSNQVKREYCKAKRAAAEREWSLRSAALKSFTLAPAVETTWVFAGSTHLDPGAYAAQFLLPAGCTLSQVEIAPPCVNGIEPPGGWQPAAVTTAQDLAVTALKAIDLEHEPPPAASPIEITGDQFQVEAPPQPSRTARRRRASRRWRSARGARACARSSPSSCPSPGSTSMGPCAFDLERLSFGGTAEEQARCLMRPVGPRAKLGPVPDALPPVFAARIGGDTALPSRAALTIVLTEDGLRETFGPALLWPVSRALDADPFAPAARYLVLHDTSGPYLRRFPGDLDSHRRLNNLARFRCSDGWELAHVVINRPGEVFVAHDFTEPWRATKFERAVNFGTDLKGLFLLRALHGRAGREVPAARARRPEPVRRPVRAVQQPRGNRSDPRRRIHRGRDRRRAGARSGQRHAGPRLASRQRRRSH